MAVVDIMRYDEAWKMQNVMNGVQTRRWDHHETNSSLQIIIDVSEWEFSFASLYVRFIEITQNLYSKLKLYNF